jgi:hypothetical protein
VERVLNYWAGAAKVCITPEEPRWLAGYASRTAPARGKISDLYASALALAGDHGGGIVIASIDLIAVTPDIVYPVLLNAFENHGIQKEQLLIAATHTHYGPEFRREKARFFGIPDNDAAALASVADKLEGALYQAIELAISRMGPVRVFARQTKAGFAHNRRRRGVKDGTPSSEDMVDHDVPVLECVDAAGHRKAIVFGYACHNTTIPPGDLRYCGDWAGFAKTRLEQSFPDAVAIFIPGAAADQDPEPSGSVELSQQHGRELADAIEQELQQPGDEITGPIRSADEFVNLPLRAIDRQQLHSMLESGDPPQQVKAKFLLDALDGGETLRTTYSAPVQVVRLGDELMIVALSGEPVIDWALKLKRELSDMLDTPGSSVSALGSQASKPMVWVAGYCHDMFGYLPTRRVQREGGYEGGRANLWSAIPAPFTEEAEDLITDAVRRLVQKTGGHEKQ